MGKFRKGDKVAAVKDIGGMLRELVPAGSIGIVTQGGWGADTRVLFAVKGGWLSGEKKVEIRVDDHEIY